MLRALGVFTTFGRAQSNFAHKVGVNDLRKKEKSLHRKPSPPPVATGRFLSFAVGTVLAGRTSFFAWRKGG